MLAPALRIASRIPAASRRPIYVSAVRYASTSSKSASTSGKKTKKLTKKLDENLSKDSGTSSAASVESPPDSETIASLKTAPAQQAEPVSVKADLPPISEVQKTATKVETPTEFAVPTESAVPTEVAQAGTSAELSPTTSSSTAEAAIPTAASVPTEPLSNTGILLETSKPSAAAPTTPTPPPAPRPAVRRVPRRGPVYEDERTWHATVVRGRSALTPFQ
ncbi:hypothetical protein FA95DRAFT_1587906, partial [Auriscalpium vulgare]